MFKRIRDLLDVIIYLIVIIAIFYIGYAIFFPQHYAQVARYKPYVVVSNSMVPKIMPMSLIIVDKRPDTPYLVNDIITFKHDINSDGHKEIITHRIAEIKNENGVYYRTRPELGENDKWVIAKRNVIGKVSRIIPVLGFFVLSIQKVAIPILIVSNLIIILLLWQTFIRWNYL